MNVKKFLFVVACAVALIMGIKSGELVKTYITGQQYNGVIEETMQRTADLMTESIDSHDPGNKFYMEFKD